MSATSGKRLGEQAVVERRTAEEIVDLTDKVDAQGRLTWDVPPGQWALVRFGFTTIDGHEYDVDVLDAKAVEGTSTAWARRSWPMPARWQARR
jgi:hypothetical protein